MTGLREASLLLACCAGLPAIAAEADDARGLRSVSLGYEWLQIDSAYFRDIRVSGFEVQAESLQLGLVYGLDAHWSVSLSLPFVRRRYRGPPSHDPAALGPGYEHVPHLDNGQFHGNWQDYRIGLRHGHGSGGWSFQEYLVAHLPSHDYPHFGNAAIGQNLWKLQAGASVSYLLESWPLYWSADVSYTRVEETLGQNVDHWIADVGVGWLVSDDFALSLFVREKSGNGTTTFPTREHFYQHDRMQPLEYRSAGATIEWALADDYALALQWSTMLDGYTVLNIDAAANLTLTRYFD